MYEIIEAITLEDILKLGEQLQDLKNEDQTEEENT